MSQMCDMLWDSVANSLPATHHDLSHVVKVVRLRHKQALRKGRVGSIVVEWTTPVKPELPSWGRINGTIVLDGFIPFICLPSPGLTPKSDPDTDQEVKVE
jgi:hypothetical protein